jgi:SAM-dependent methyltransferase
MDNTLTNREYWREYWKNYRYKKVPKKMYFDRYIPATVAGKTFIEIGGFPGTMPIYFHKKYQCDVSLLDFYIDREMVTEMELTNNIPVGTVKCIESDFFEFTPDRLYDFVSSFGFIEHFDDTQDIIKRHIDLLASNGSLLIVLPNFLGLNGLIQRIFDRETFDAHNLKSMEIQRLKKIMNGFNLKNISIKYTRKPVLWLEPKPAVSQILRLLVRGFGVVLRLFPVRCKLLSPYIVISAQK